MKKLWQLIEKLFGIYRWHPTIALRYLPIVEEIKKIESTDWVLEVGSGGLGITPYLQKPVVGVDIAFSPPMHTQLIPVIASATQLPFADSSFDVVVSTDMLEHVSKNLRIKAISEMLRVGKKLICIGVPCGKISQAQDGGLAHEYKRTHREEFDFFAEHAQMGLPDKSEILETISMEAAKLNKKIMVKNQGILNIEVRWWLMKGWISDNWLVNIFFRKVLLLGVPLLKRLNNEPTYRQLFFVTIS